MAIRLFYTLTQRLIVLDFEYILVYNSVVVDLLYILITSRDPHTGNQMSQGAVKSQPPKVGIEPGPQDLRANTLPRRCKAGFYRKAVEVCCIYLSLIHFDCCQAHRGVPVGFLLLRYSVLFTDASLSLLCLLFIS